MTIEEAVTAARKNVPVVYDSPMLGPQLYARIGCIRKSFPLRSDRERGASSVSCTIRPFCSGRERVSRSGRFRARKS